MKKSIVILSVIVSAFAFNACNTTSILQSWKNPEYKINKDDYKKVLVAVLGNGESVRRVGEDFLAGKNSKFIQSYTYIPTKEIAADTAKCREVLEKANFDAVLTMRLVDKVETTNYVAGTSYTTGYWGWHGMYWGSYYEPGYYQKDKTYMVETKLFSLKEDAVLWVGATSTLNPNSLEQSIEDIGKTVLKSMQEDGLFVETAE